MPSLSLKQSVTGRLMLILLVREHVFPCSKNQDIHTIQRAARRGSSATIQEVVASGTANLRAQVFEIAPEGHIRLRQDNREQLPVRARFRQHKLITIEDTVRYRLRAEDESCDQRWLLTVYSPGLNSGALASFTSTCLALPVLDTSVGKTSCTPVSQYRIVS